MKQLGFQYKLFLASTTIVLITIASMAGVNFVQSRAEYLASGVTAMENVSRTLRDTVSMQDRLARNKIMSDLNIFKSIMGVGGLPMFEILYDVDMTVTNQTTGESESVTIPAFKLGSGYLHESTDLVDTMSETAGVRSSVLQRDGDRFIRVSTTLAAPSGETLQGLSVPAESPAAKAILEGKRYEGLAVIGGQWRLTAYEAIRDYDEKVIGALEVARPVIGPDFARFIGSANVSGKGYSYVLRANGSFPVPAADPDAAAAVAEQILAAPQAAGQGVTLAADIPGDTVQSRVIRFDPWDAYLVTSVNTSDLLAGVDTRIVKSALLSSVLPLLLSFVVIWITSRQLMSPMNRLAMLADEVSKGNFDCDFEYRAGDAIGRTMASVKHMVAEMKNQLGFSRGVLDGVTIPCAVVDLDNRLTHINQAAVEILGKRKTPKDYLGLTLNEVTYHDARRKTLTQVAIKKHKQVEWEIDLRRDIDKKEIILHVVATPIHDLDGEPIGAISIWVDLTEERHQKQAVEAKNSLIEAAAREANDIAENVSSAARGLAGQIASASKGAQEQSSRAMEASLAMEQMNKTVSQVAKNATDTARMSEETLDLARSGQKVVNTSVDMIRMVDGQSRQLRSQMDELGDQARGIGAIMDVIGDIADQTNLLALNAAIEAARAGDAGRGFAVVADEVRKLAEKTMDATREVGAHIDAIQKSAESNIESTDKASKALDKCRGMVEQSGSSLQGIVDKIGEASTQVQTIATAAEQQAAASQQVHEATDTVNSIAGQTADSMRESTAAIEALNTLAEDLRRAIGRMQG